jgi:protein-L-isoaspartate(D-aspartate) O-methyltransferase
MSGQGERQRTQEKLAFLVLLVILIAMTSVLYYGFRREREIGPREPAVSPITRITEEREKQTVFADWDLPEEQITADDTTVDGEPGGERASPDTGEKWSPPRFSARQRERDRMVGVIRAYGLTDEAVLRAMSAVPRHEFVPENYSSSAYIDSPLPIGYGQTISQPYMVAEMTRQLRLNPDSRVLEVGTGSGYQAAVLTEFTPHVYSVEIIGPLATTACKRLNRLGYAVVQSGKGDGYYGWPKEAPFDAIIVTCAAGQIPPPLIKQLAPGGRMVIPVGSPFATQSLMLVTKDSDGKVRSTSLMLVRFVPLVRKEKL